MTSAIRNMSFLILLLIPTIGQCAEFASWWQQTKYGNEVCSEKGAAGYINSIKCRMSGYDNINGHTISNLDRWYFYQAHIVGEIVDNDKRSFFLFNELTCQSEVFSGREAFDERITELRLKPKIWTRWYKENYGLIITDGDFGDGLVFFLVIRPALFIITLVTLIGLIRTNLNLRHPFNKVMLFIVGLVLVRIILDVYPGSI